MATPKKVIPVVKSALRNPPTEVTSHEAKLLAIMENEKPYHGKNPLEKGYQLRHNLNGDFDWFPDYDNRPDLHPVH